MMNEDKYIQDRVGKRNPFQVPEGYFEDFAQRMMAQLPEVPQGASEVEPQQPKARFIRLRPAYYAVAASVCALLVSAAVWLWQPETDAPQVATLAQQPSAIQAAESASQEDAFDEAADYVMLDNQEIYACLSDDVY